MLRLDRPLEEIIKPLTNDWKREATEKRLTQLQRAEIAFSADLIACRFEGLYPESRKAWANMSEQERIRWSKTGPTKCSAFRLSLFLGIMELADADVA